MGKKIVENTWIKLITQRDLNYFESLKVEKPFFVYLEISKVFQGNWEKDSISFLQLALFLFLFFGGGCFFGVFFFGFLGFFFVLLW